LLLSQTKLALSYAVLVTPGSLRTKKMIPKEKKKKGESGAS